MKIIKYLCLVSLPWFLTACGSIPTPSSGDKAAETSSQSKPVQTGQREPAPVDAIAQAPAAVLSLMKRAEQQSNSGDHNAAIASLERAIRIAPRYPETYYRLGEQYFSQGRYNQARSLAEKSIILGADWLLRQQAESLIKRATASQ